MFDWKSLLKYILEGLAVAVATFLIPSKKIEYTDIIMIALTAAATFAVLDQFSPMVAVGARQGTGFGIGYQQIGLGDPAEESNEPSPPVQTEGDMTCQMTDGVCTYAPNASDEQRRQFMCQEKEGVCTGIPTEVEGFAGFQKMA